MKKNPLSFQLKIDDFIKATESEKHQVDLMRDSVGFWSDALRRFKKNKVAMVSFFTLIVIMILVFGVASFYPYSYEEQFRGAENLAPMQYSKGEQAIIASGGEVFPHIM